MKLRPTIRQICLIAMVTKLILGAAESFSQQMIIFKDGIKLEAFITYQTKDTVKYYLKSQPQVVYVETMDHIGEIVPLNDLTGIPPDSLEKINDQNKYLHYKRVTISGAVLVPIGAILCGIGAAGLSAHDMDTFASSAFAVGLGSGLLITGVIQAIAGSVQMSKYKERLHGFSFDFRCTPQVKGISLAYRF
jgi:hypothetical protein